MINTINNYDEIKIIPKSLIIFDIDETILILPKIDYGWWHKQFDYYVTIYNDNTKATDMTILDWHILTSHICPLMLAYIKFVNILYEAKKFDCEIILLTSRSPILSSITEHHLNSVGLNMFKNKIYYACNKGDKIFEIVKSSSYENIIFIDDNINNLQQAKISFWMIKNPKLHLYQMKHKNNPGDLFIDLEDLTSPKITDIQKMTEIIPKNLILKQVTSFNINSYSITSNLIQLYDNKIKT